MTTVDKLLADVAATTTVRSLIGRRLREAPLSSALYRVPDVYFIQQGWSGPVKIGVARSPQRRMAELQTASPYVLRLLGVVPHGGTPLEGELHQRHAVDRLYGEWFQPTAAVLA